MNINRGERRTGKRTTRRFVVETTTAEKALPAVAAARETRTRDKEERGSRVGVSRNGQRTSSCLTLKSSTVENYSL